MTQNTFLSRLKESILVCDGAMGTMIYSHGVFINRCFDELNLSAPELISEIHGQYVAAHADILETNTFGANIFKLRPYGFADKVQQINKRGAELARSAALNNQYIAGSIGPLGLSLRPFGNLDPEEAMEAYICQAEGLLAGGVDLFILETFRNIDELAIAIRAVKKISGLPVIAQATFDETGATQSGNSPDQLVDIALSAGADVVGANCSVGPQPMLQVIEQMAAAGAKLLSAQPNAGNPRVHEGRFLYMSTPEYHAEFARRLINAGANIIGGCCGTTPEHIKNIASAVRAMQPRKTAAAVTIKPKKEIQVTVVPTIEKSTLAKKMREKFVVSVEIVSPRGVNVAPIMDGVKKLVDFGVDAINLPDGPRASARMSPMAMAQLIEKSLPVETILHYCCRDRNLLGMQSDLLGAYALGLRNVLIITGDPPKLGDYPDATAVFDVDAIGLTRVVQGLNQGFDIAGNPIGQPTSWHIGVGVNPGALDLDHEIERLRQKIDNGAEFILSQPIFDIKQLETFLKRIEDITIPILAGISPLISYRSVEFLNNEVPGVHVPDEIGNKLAGAKDAEEAQTIGIKIAQQAILDVKAFDKIKGLYLMPPFTKDKYTTAVQVLQVLK
ncbi:MAG TPA: bifunctional homocysteine S-methyltransferase/methylenetetrahydrofolate reductase [bacterium]|nr:bifunctional homocysteine S-methyltransferase/methylenetetrahydrofolate reductase [bacterium]HPN44676.1 bifunctional homocysteine S-methyltransferase/methylenetetrahydrofolate reductase [bacterium]